MKTVRRRLGFSLRTALVFVAIVAPIGLLILIVNVLSPFSSEISGMPADTAVLTTLEKVPAASENSNSSSSSSSSAASDSSSGVSSSVSSSSTSSSDSSSATSGITSGSTSTQSSAASKIVYLTFDDGPGAYTAKLLDILKKYNVKATFFVTCAGSDDLIKREYDEGHTVALHTCSHNYAQVYASDDAYFADLTKIQDRVKNITGYTSWLLRFPGGSSNMVSAKYSYGIMSRLVQSVTWKGFTYFDWNVSSGDAGGATTADAVCRNVIAGFGRFSNGAVVLQHDIKGYSVDAVERIIQYGQANGFVFQPLIASSYAAHHGVNN